MKNIKTLFIPIIVFFMTYSLHAQFGVAADYNFGGSGFDLGFDLDTTSDGGYVMVGYSDSEDNDVSEAFGMNDLWMVKVDADGNIDWESSFGGSDKEVGRMNTATADGAWVVVGYTESIDGDITDNNGIKDAWVIKVDGTGELVWQSTFGGEFDDLFNYVINTADGGYLCVGSSKSLTGDLTSNYGQEDVWVVKIDADGFMEWQKNYGGSFPDIANSVIEVADGFIFAGESGSNDIDVSGNHQDGATPFTDFWVVKIETDGDIVWQKCYGGFDHESAKYITANTDGDYMIAGSAQSDDGDVSGHYGAVNKTDAWVIKIDEDGTLLENRNYGGSFNDNVYAIEKDLDGGYILSGQSNSMDFDIVGHHGGASTADFWVFKLDSDLDIVFSSSLGGEEDDVAQAAFQIGTDSYIAGGYTKSIDGDVTDHYGATLNHDYWLVALGPCSLEITADPGDITACEGQDVTFTVETSTGGAMYSWVFIDGPTLTTLTNTLVIEDITEAYSGDYYVVVSGACGEATSETSTLTVNAFPAPDISPATETSICLTGFIIFSTSASGAGYTYQWYLDGIAISGATTSIYVATAGGTYSVTVSNAEGCSGSSITVEVTDEGPEATVTVDGSTNLCATGSVTLTTIAGAGYTYQWYKDGLPITGATLISYTATEVGSYYCVVEADGCTSTSTVTAVTDSGPTATIAAGGNLDICETGSVALNSTTTGTGLAYQWLLNNTPVIGALGVSLIAIDTGDYTLVVTNTMGCKDTSEALVVFNSCVAIQDIESFANISINPNPSSGYIAILFENIVAAEDINLEILDMQSMVVYNTILPTMQVISKTIDLTNLPAGNYFMKAVSGNAVMMEKIIIQ